MSFARGAPSLDIIDVDGLSAAAQRALTDDPGGTTAYGTAGGYMPLRAWIAERHGVDVAQVLVTNGSMQADVFLFDTLVEPGDAVVVERPTYDRTLLALRERGAELHPIVLEADGLDVDALRVALEGGVKPKFAHVIPNFQNPTGYTLSGDKRRALLALAREHDFLVFEDDPYVDLRFRGQTLPTMLSLDDHPAAETPGALPGGHVVYASSFSKTVCPGVRVGYLIGPAALIASIQRRATNTYISPNMLAQSVVFQFASSGAITRSIETVKRALGERAERLGAALERELPEARFALPDGGYFTWIELPDEVDVDAVFTAAGERGVAFIKGTDFLLEGGRNTLRLAYSGVRPDEIDEGIRRLAEAVHAATGGW
ncbi:MAG: PLP-dependent aminotransferase family protein [Solirubrobacterales bacterium]|nr:PLP-dependent aminotransferase family protein [Solirubrobacterales bacterium]